MSENKIKCGFDNMDFNKVTEMLSKAYWSIGIGIDEVKKGASNSALVVGVFNQGVQIGYARVISDKTRFAYICDVIVEENQRRKGIGISMIDSILRHEELKDVYQWLLVTKDAHGVYAKSGFEVLKNPNMWMGMQSQIDSHRRSSKKE